ncbi:hypothetical protein FPQ18DRAFT_334912 [Pyronema domesticum]|uniref:Similar to UPF0676 protein C1494.01 acc. no. Q7LL04 n=1 Tax=Pyronema omphalodes (strain CBS 100304) TaxID=1076935 RepID=U4LTM9_PYROM|nr:hypothetical protein FPQ18DRAFT_334912 [Pyronema domesticum]CCX30926.1 Similar to UPF0676 protein C1494.01; acc. no. Q7LL04 [Pyronema omphalodes CBS 100304]
MPADAKLDLITLTDTPECASALLESARTLGFLYITFDGTEFTPENVSEMFGIAKEFFASPEDEKSTCPISADNKGWSGMHTETLDPATQKRGDFKQAMNFGEFLNGSPQQPITPTLAPHIPTISRFSDMCATLSRRLMRLFAEALEIEASAGGAEYFTASHTSSNGPSGSIMRLLYYPATTPNYEKGVDIRAGAHSDYGSLTLLFQHQESGLEILSQGGWSPVPVVKDAICVNIGDLLSYWTGGLLKSTVHRVVVPKGGEQRDRYSMAYFCHPVDTTLLEAIPSEQVKQRGQRGANEAEKAITAAEHLKGRLAATYGWKEKGAGQY